ncbi:hypothetical protein [Runella slithyformis]|uniref:Uncharacterized protein n=1 Tax=Runella slithyformis (strain ATCC 29530 / DSM 19594 / LMG 11500 / NCIMB 11436 / LSU 4) TaxID=761193 RepID=A0A7U3ZHC0_RUNSL|nr:hypothetical protein [Runella slithyformis]AEI47170.1 hypothetical protein Runsl_0729 [Runella slithyformis DSM 19594]
MKTIVFSITFSFFFLLQGLAQKKTMIAYFPREVSIKDSITISLIDNYIQKVQDKKVVHLSIAATQDTIFYRLEAIATIETITEHIKPFFIFQYKGYYFLVDNGLGRMVQGNDLFAQYITKKLKKYLVRGETIKDAGNGVKDVTFIIYEAPVMFATYSRGGVKVRWDGL